MKAAPVTHRFIVNRANHRSDEPSEALLVPANRFEVLECRAALDAAKARTHDPGHILLEAAWADAATGLLDIGRLGAFLGRIHGRIRHQALTRVSPLAVPMLLEIGKQPVAQSQRDDILQDASQILIAEALNTEPGP